MDRVDNRALFVVSYAKDADYFRMCARSVAKFATGFAHRLVAVPESDFLLFKQIAEENRFSIVAFPDWPGKGQLRHQCVKCHADKFFGPEIEHIFHMDSDCVFWKPTDSEEYFRNGKPILAFRPFNELLTAPVDKDEQMSFMGFTGRRFDFNRGQYLWKFAADFALGWPVERETMQWMPIVHVRATYEKTREVVSQRFGRSLENHISTCRNEFPQNFCEFNTLGGVAHRYLEHRYHWAQVSGGFPFQSAVQVWSHGGWDRADKFPAEAGGEQTPRQLYQRLGLI